MPAWEDSLGQVGLRRRRDTDSPYSLVGELVKHLPGCEYRTYQATDATSQGSSAKLDADMAAASAMMLAAWQVGWEGLWLTPAEASASYFAHGSSWSSRFTDTLASEVTDVLKCVSGPTIWAQTTADGGRCPADSSPAMLGIAAAALWSQLNTQKVAISQAISGSIKVLDFLLDKAESGTTVADVIRLKEFTTRCANEVAHIVPTSPEAFATKFFGYTDNADDPSIALANYAHSLLHKRSTAGWATIRSSLSTFDQQVLAKDPILTEAFMSEVMKLDTDALLTALDDWDKYTTNTHPST